MSRRSGHRFADKDMRNLRFCTTIKGTTMSSVIDIHPHIIANDTKRYPLAPLGGHQSDWSRTRPVTTEQMIAAMDTAGGPKAAIPHASTPYRGRNASLAAPVAACPAA